ncbi:MAG: AAA family ATPase, partial [Methanobrevibacter sp.]|nr:AAA family ATPase [Methanobrevibacter sp.]
MEQQKIADEMCEDLKPITFIQGKAGTGKSYLIKELVDILGIDEILCPTNLAKQVYEKDYNVSAKTIHSFFFREFDAIDEGFQNPNEYDYVRNEDFISEIHSKNIIVIDEVSMVRSDLLEMIHKILSTAMGNVLPFGGIKIILVGDLFQLPPVVESDETLKYLNNEYGGVYFFDSHVIQENLSQIKFYELNESVRHKDDSDWVEMLDMLREPPKIKKIIPILKEINTRVVPPEQIPERILAITPSNAEANKINKRELDKIQGEEFTSKANFKIKELAREEYLEFEYGDELENVDTSKYYPIEVPSRFDPFLTYKIGARVMFTGSVMGGAKNGDFGTIIDKRVDVDPRWGEKVRILVKLDKNGRTVYVSLRDYSATDYKYEMVYDPIKHTLSRNTPYIQRVKQYPFKLGYAFTIHKSQGQSFDNMLLDLKSNIFASGQLYVALSRVRTLDGLYLTRPVAFSDIIVDEKIIQFLEYLKTGEYPPISSQGSLVDFRKSKNTPLNDLLVEFAQQTKFNIRQGYAANYAIKRLLYFA